MSLNGMADAALARRSDMTTEAEVGGPGGVSPRRPAESSPAGDSAGASSGSRAASQVNDAVRLLSNYIPGEILTVYVAVLAALKAPVLGSSTGHWITFCVFLAATPIVQWAVYSAKVKAAGKPLPLGPTVWPKWEMIAATLAYTAWAFALPQSPFGVFGWYSAALSGVVVLAASTVLGLLAPFFQREITVA